MLHACGIQFLTKPVSGIQRTGGQKQSELLENGTTFDISSTRDLRFSQRGVCIPVWKADNG